MKRTFLFLFFAALFIFLAACEKDSITPGPNPDPDPNPDTNPVILVEVDFSQKPADITLSFGISGTIVLADANKVVLKAIPYTFPVSSISLTGDMAKQQLGKKLYVLIGVSRIRNNVGSGLVVHKKIEPILVAPAVNKVVIPIPDDLSQAYQFIDP